MNHKFIVVASAALLSVVPLLNSCNLDVVNPTDVSSDTFWKRDADVWNALNTIYSNIIPGIGIYDDAFSDDVRCPYPWESNGSTFQVNGLSTSADMGYNFVAIRRVNNLLTNIKNVPMDEALKERVIAEARVLRAYRYAVMTNDFGKVPLITELKSYDEKMFKRDDAAAVRSFVLKEFQESIPKLPTKYSGGYFNETSRLTRYGAQALLARVALQFKEYAIAEQAAREVMKGGFALHTLTSLPAGTEAEVAQLKQLVDFDALGLDADKFIQGVYNYRSTWDDAFVTSSSPECIIIREYKGGNADYADLTRYTSMRPQQMVDGWSSVVPQQPLIDAYWTADGKTFAAPSKDQRATAYNKLTTDYKEVMKNEKKSFRAMANEWIESGKYLGYEYFKEFKNRDPRLYASILFPFHRVSDYDAGPDFVYEWQKGANNESTTGYNFLKMVARSTSTMLWSAYPASEADFPVFRYAEILLIFAEAHTQNSGYDAEVAAALNQLRDRVGMPHVPASLSKEAGLELIRGERHIELAGEGSRLNDLKRYGSAYAKKVMDNVEVCVPDGTAVITMKWNDRMMLYPIPQTAIDVNPGLASDQNPGY